MALAPIVPTMLVLALAAVGYCAVALALAEQAGSSKAVNIVLMGHLSRYFDFTEEEWMDAIAKSVPAKFLELNKTAVCAVA